jgi:hypothetical protein
MVATTHYENGPRSDLASSGLNAESIASNIRNISRNNRKPASLHVMPAAKAKKPSSGPSEKIVDALADDGDPAVLLAEVREVLFGPTRKLQEARLDELVGILEEIDREVQVTHRRVTEQLADADAADRQLASDLLATNKQIEDLAQQHERGLAEANGSIHALAEKMKQEILRVAEFHQRELEQQAEDFSSKLDKFSAVVFRQMDEMSGHQKLSTEALATDFNGQMRELISTMKSSDEEILSQFEQRFAQVNAFADDEKSRSIRVLTEGLSSLSERLRSL